MPKIPESLKSLLMFLPKDKIEQLVPIAKRFENIGKNVMGESTYSTLSSVANGFTTGVMSGDILNGIVTEIAINNENRFAALLKKNYVVIKEMFIKQIEDNDKVDMENPNSLYKLIALFEQNFPEDKIRVILTKLHIFLKRKDIQQKFMQSQRAISTSMNGGNEKCNNDIELKGDENDDANNDENDDANEQAINADFTDKVYFRYSCELNDPDEITNINDEYKSSVIDIFALKISELLKNDYKKIANFVATIEEGNTNNQENVGGSLLTNLKSQIGKSVISKGKNVASKLSDKIATNVNPDMFKKVDSVISSATKSGLSNSENLMDVFGKQAVDFAATMKPTIEKLISFQPEDKYQTVLERILNGNIKKTSKLLAIKLHNLTYTIFDDYYPHATIDTMLIQQCVTVLTGKQFPDMTVMNAVSSHESSVATGGLSKNIKELDKQNEIIKFIIGDLTALFCNSIIKKLENIAIEYNKIVERKMKTIMNQVFDETNSVNVEEGGAVGGKPTSSSKRRRRKTKRVGGRHKFASMRTTTKRMK